MVINDGAAQRSSVYSVRVPAADYPAGALLVRVSGAPMRVLPNQEVRDGELRLWFVSDPQCVGGSLPDGRWCVVPVGGHFHRLYGDSDGDATVGAADFAAFANTFGSSSSDPEYRREFDGNGDGVIDSTDFLDFANRYGTSI